MAKKKYSLANVIFSSALIHNPVLIQTVGLCPVVAAASTLQNALLLAAAFVPVMIITQSVACLMLKRVPRWIRVTLYMLIGTAILAPAIFLIDRYMPEIRIGAGLYFALIAVNSITALHCEKLAVKSNFRYAFFDAVAACIGYAGVIIVVGFLRELLGASSVLGRAVNIPFTFPGLLMPFGGFILLAFCAAGLKWFINRRFPEYSSETELEIKKTAVIISKKNLPENLAPKPEQELEKEPAAPPEELEEPEVLPQEAKSQGEPEEQTESSDGESAEAEPADLLEPLPEEDMPPQTAETGVEDIIDTFRREHVVSNNNDEDFSKKLNELFRTIDMQFSNGEGSEKGED